MVQVKRDPVVAIFGATGVVGSEMLGIIEERNLPVGELRLFASEDSAGEVYRFGDDEVVVQTLKASSFEGVDVALFSLSASLAENFVPLAVKAGAVVIDNSSHFRMDPEVPLVVPEVNFDAITADTKIIANPNCSTIQLVPVLQAIHEAAGLQRVVVSTYQAVSGAGKAAMDELWNQTRGIFSQTEIESEAFAHQIAFNCIPQIDVLLENGYTKEEFKIINESRKILSIPDLRITATAVRVPVFNSHAESVNVETEKPLSPTALAERLESVDGIEVYSNTAVYPMQINASGEDEIHVGRIRKDESVENGLELWIVADNLRKGAALNAVQILEKLLQ
jgi:aspartate-semialdehyde dehydrogenase